MLSEALLACVRLSIQQELARSIHVTIDDLSSHIQY